VTGILLKVIMIQPNFNLAYNLSAMLWIQTINMNGIAMITCLCPVVSLVV